MVNVLKMLLAIELQKQIQSQNEGIETKWAHLSKCGKLLLPSATNSRAIQSKSYEPFARRCSADGAPLALQMFARHLCECSVVRAEDGEFGL